MIASFFYPYGANRNVKIFIGSDDPDTRKEFSELCGQKKVKNFSVNTHAENSASATTGASNQPLITVGMLERINGNEKGDAIVSVRGYEPIWTRFTPSFKLKDLYFKEGKADIGKREAVLFDKDNYVFDITGRNGKSEEDRQLDRIEEKDHEVDMTTEDKKKRIDELDKEWQAIYDDVQSQIEQLAIVLTGRDSKALRAAKLENKAPLLYAIMENYELNDALSIRNTADRISKESLPKLKKLQNSAVM